MMSLKYLSLGIAAAALACGLVATSASAETAAQARRRAETHGSATGYSYMSGPHTRVYISKRSWLDAGTEVLPGERKFTDYATGGPNQFEYLDRLNSHMDFRRQPMNTPADLGGRPTGFPLY
jgi:hypothetical protein